MEKPARSKPARGPRRRGLTLVLASVLTAVGLAVWLAGRRPDRARGDAPDLVVATYNLNFGVAGDETTLDAIRDTRADVVLLQETSDAWELAIRAALGGVYPHMTFVASDWPAGGIGIVSRFPLRDIAVSESPIGWFPALRAVVDTPGGAVQLLDVHLKPPVSNEGSYVSGYFSTPAERDEEMRAHAGLLDPTLPTIVAGDFNEQSGGGLAVLEEMGMRLATDDLPSGTKTWRWTIASVTLRQRFDHIVYDPQRFAVQAIRVDDAGRSDHLPVVAELKLVRAR